MPVTSIELGAHEPIFAVLHLSREEREADRKLEILLPDQPQAVGDVVTAATVLDADVDGREGTAPHRNADALRIMEESENIRKMLSHKPFYPASEEYKRFLEIGRAHV